MGRSPLVDRLADEALERVAGRQRAGRDDPEGTALDRLYAAAIGPDPRACAAVARALMADGLPAERICDHHIPATARRMGDDWVSDDLAFSAVTIGTARLQGLLRDLDAEIERDGGPRPGDGGAVLLVIAPGADHTLGALLLASQLRRRGFSVRLSLGEARERMAAAVAGTRFDAVFLSATVPGSLPFLAEAALAIRGAAPRALPIVLGGAVLALSEGAGESAAAARIDHVTCDIDEAIRLCGLTAAP